MVEGGVRVLGSFFDSGLWDRAAVTLVPRWIGGYRLQVPRPVHLEDVRWAAAGDDVLCLGRRSG
jgi:riboflavin biosynthesis pyrimidine reductase